MGQDAAALGAGQGSSMPRAVHATFSLSISRQQDPSRPQKPEHLFDTALSRLWPFGGRNSVRKAAPLARR